MPIFSSASSSKHASPHLQRVCRSTHKKARILSGLFYYLLEVFGFLLEVVFFGTFFTGAFRVAAFGCVLARLDTALADFLPVTFWLIEAGVVCERCFFCTRLI